MNKKNIGIILAGGSGIRFGGDLPKQFVKIAGKTVVEHTLRVFEKNKNISEIIVVVNPDYYDLMNELILRNDFKKVSKILNGGDSRRESSYIGINACDEGNVLIHDAIRPFISDRIINDMIRALEKYPAVDVAINSADTIIKINNERIIEEVPERKYLKRGQTPQGFKLDVIKKAHKMFLEDDNPKPVTDDCSLILNYNLGEVYVVEGETKNIKLTYPEDIFLADKLFQLNSFSLISGKSFSFEILKNKTIVIFGHSSGIGKETFKLAEHYGAKVHGFSLREGIDVTNYDAVKKSLDEVYSKEGKIDFVITTAGVLKIAKLENLSQKEIFNQLNINLIGSINVVKCSIEYLKKSKGMLILFGSSSYTRGRATYGLYSAAKAGLVNFTQAMAEELIPYSVKINIIVPERCATPMRFKNFGKEPEDSLMNPKKVAEATLRTLFSDITGAVIDVKR